MWLAEAVGSQSGSQLGCLRPHEPRNAAGAAESPLSQVMQAAGRPTQMGAKVTCLSLWATPVSMSREGAASRRCDLAWHALARGSRCRLRKSG
jgi:hypothetical protein